MNDFLFFRPPAAKFQRRKSVFFGNFEKKAQDAVAFGKKNWICLEMVLLIDLLNYNDLNRSLSGTSALVKGFISR